MKALFQIGPSEACVSEISIYMELLEEEEPSENGRNFWEN